MSNVLFTVTKDHLETGMRGYPVGYCTTSSVDPQKGLFYQGQPVSALAECLPEEVIYLLFFGEMPGENELRDFTLELKRRSQCTPELLSALHKLPRKAHPMVLFSSALLLLGVFEGTGDYWEDGLNVVAKLPHLVAELINFHAGWERGSQPDSELGYMENFEQMLAAPNIERKEFSNLLRLFNVLHYDHGGGNLSTFVGKAVASGLGDLFGSLSASMSALAGPRHGKANQDCLRFVEEVAARLGENPSAEALEQLLREKLQNKELIYGFGHAVLRVEDPRATLFYQLTQKHYPEHPLVKVAHLLRQVGPKVLGENPKISNPYPNVDAISGIALSAAGFTYPEYYTLLFGLSRVVGITRQIVYERCEARDGKGLPIVRPKYFYKPPLT